MRSNGRDAGQNEFDGFSCLDDHMVRRIGVAVENNRGPLNTVQLIDRDLVRRYLRCVVGPDAKRRTPNQPKGQGPGHTQPSHTVAVPHTHGF